MALLGAQLVLTLVMVSVIQKLGGHYSLARWLLCSTGLVRFLYPTNEELRSLAGIPREKPRGKKHHKGEESGSKPETFHVPRNLELQLETAKVTALDVVHLRYYAEYQWLVDFSLYTAIVYTFTEIYLSYFPAKDEVNLSMMWCLLLIGFSFKMLVSLTLQYFHGEESIGERSTCIVTGCAYLLVAMMVLIVDEKTLEVGLEEAYHSFNESASAFLDSQGLTSSGPASKLILKLSLAVWCGLVGSLFTFPGLRMARMHWDSLSYCKGNKFLQLLLNISFALPFILVVLWIKPVSRDYLTERIFSGMDKPIMTGPAFDTMRLIAVVVAVLLRVVLMPLYLQAYLNMAYNRLEQQKKEAGRITNIELQRKISAVFYYLCVVTLQYMAPLILCLYFSLMFKTLGGYTWTGLLSGGTGGLGEGECGLEPPAPPLITPLPEGEDAGAPEQTITESAQHFHLAMENLKSVFTPYVFRGLLGFATWWSCFAWFATTSMGMVYQSYFRQS